MCLSRCEALLGITVTMYNITWCTFVMFYFIHFHLFTEPSPPVKEILLTILFASSLLTALFAYFRCCITSPGAPPAWLSEANVESFVRNVLQDIVDHNPDIVRQADVLSPNNGERPPVSVHSANESALSANKAFAAAQKQRAEPIRPQKGPDTHEMTEVHIHTEDTTPPPLSAADGLKPQVDPIPDRTGQTPTRHVALVAAEVLRAMSRSREAYEEDISFLLGGARYCRFCRVYKLGETEHCHKCRTCVYEMDQHCPLMGRCIGYDNHKYMILFVFYLLLACVTILVHGKVFLHRQELPLFSADVSGVFLFSWMTILACAMILFLFLAQCMALLLRGESTLRLIREEERSYIASQRRALHGETFSMLADVVEEAPSKGCSVSHLRRVFGTDVVMPWWFLPLAPGRPKAEEQENTFWALQRGLIERQLAVLMTEPVESGSHSDTQED